MGIVARRRVDAQIRTPPSFEAQSGMAERNAGLPSQRRIEFRIGIHPGARALTLGAGR